MPVAGPHATCRRKSESVLPVIARGYLAFDKQAPIRSFERTVESSSLIQQQKVENRIYCALL